MSDGKATYEFIVVIISQGINLFCQQNTSCSHVCVQ